MRDMVDAFVQVARFQERRALGDFSPDPKANRFPAFNQSLPPAATDTTQAVTLTELFDDWKSQHIANKKAEKTIRDYEQKCDSLRVFAKSDNVSAITKATIHTLG